MNEVIEVEARFEAEGGLQPCKFRWEGKLYRIDSHGRSWETDHEHRFLVMVENGDVYDLAFLKSEGSWRLRRSPDHFVKGRRVV